VAFERGAYIPGISCVASPVMGPEGPLGAISLVGDDSVPLERLAPLVADAARRISLTLFPGLGSRRPGRRPARPTPSRRQLLPA
jgi:DNA-binding IclR family transcriptional regulator